MTLELILPMGIEIASGLAYMHRQGVVHCDVKPGNIMLHDGVCLVSLSCEHGVEGSVVGWECLRTRHLKLPVLILPLFAHLLVQVGDLGLAQQKGDDGLYGFRGCTVPYMAPEMAQGVLPWLQGHPITGNVSALPTNAHTPCSGQWVHAAGWERMVEVWVENGRLRDTAGAKIARCLPASHDAFLSFLLTTAGDACI